MLVTVDKLEQRDRILVALNGTLVPAIVISRPALNKTGTQYKRVKILYKSDSMPVNYTYPGGKVVTYTQYLASDDFDNMTESKYVDLNWKKVWILNRVV